MGGQAEQLGTAMTERWRPGLTLAEVLVLVREVLAGPAAPDGEAREIPAAHLEVAVLDRSRPRRAFRRLSGDVLDDLLAVEPSRPAGAGPESSDPAGPTTTTDTSGDPA